MIKINYGMKDKNPVDFVNFVMRADDTTASKIRREQVSCLIPHVFQELYIRCYCKDRSPACGCARPEG